MMSLSNDKQADIIAAFNTTSRYFGRYLNINKRIKHSFPYINVCQARE